MKKTILLFVLILTLSHWGWGQSPTNPGFEDGVNDWSGSGVSSTTNIRTGSKNMSLTTSSTSNQAMTNASTINVANNEYAHVIAWAQGNNANSRASVGGSLNGSAGSTGIQTIGTTLTQLTYSKLNSTGSVATFSCRVNSRSVSGTTTLYWDDVVMYSSSGSTPDLTSPSVPSNVTTGTVTSSSVTFTWTQGSDEGTGIQNTIVLRTTNTSATAPTLNNQGQYSTLGGTSGPNTIGADWTIISITVSGSTTTYTDNTVSPSTSYKYAIIHRDLAYNFSSAALSSTITTGAATSPTISIASTMNDFGSIAVHTTSDVQSYTVSGTNLTDNITITPPTGFEISISNSPFNATNPITLTQSSGTVNSTTIYVRFSPTVIQSYNDNITHTSDGSNNPNLNTTGTGISPSNPASFSATAASTSQINLLATANANSDNIVVVYNETGTFLSPTDGVAPGNVGESFSGGTIHYKGSAGSLGNMSGLSVNQTVYFKAFSYDSYNYYSSGSTANATTLKNAPTTQDHDITFSSVGNASITVGWTNGDGDRRIVLINTINSFTDPTDGSSPSASTVYSGSGEQVVYNNTGTSVTVTGLATSTQYWFRVYNYNNTGTNTLYLTNSATLNPNSQSTNTPASFLEDFEVGSKTSYATGTVSCTMGSWTMEEALLGNGTSDKKNGAQSVRMRNASGSIYMNFNKSNGARELSVYHAIYGTDGSSTWKLQKSTDDGLNWMDVGETVTSSATLTVKTFNVNQIGNVRFKFVHVTGSSSFRLNIDDLSVTDYDKTITTTSTLPYTSYGNLTINGSGIQVTLSGNTTIDGVLTITAGTLTIGAGQTLTVSGTLTNSAGNGGLVIADGGSLITNGTVTGGATVSRTISGPAWHQMSAPVTGQTIFSGYTDMYAWDEVNYQWLNHNGGSFPDVTYLPGKGYLVSWAAGATKDFAGTLNSGNFTTGSGSVPALTYTTGKGNGFNLMGNPYPSALNGSIHTWTTTNVDNSIWVYNNGSYLTWNGTTGTLTGGIIPAMQGFWVKANATGASLTIPNTGRTHSAQSYYKSAEALQDMILLSVEGNGYKDGIVVNFNDEATEGYDGNFDVLKMYGDAAAPQFFCQTGEKELSIDVLPYTRTRTIPLGLKVGYDNTYTLQVKENTFYPSVSIVLEDLKTGQSIDLQTHPEYTFNALSSDNASRFKLHFGGALGVEDPKTAEALSIYTNDNRLCIAANTTLAGDVYVYNMVGQLLLQQKLENSALTRIAVKGPSGYYLVKVVTGQKTFTGKVFIR